MYNLKIPKIKIPKIKTPSFKRGTLPRKRDLARATNIFNKSIREQVSAKKRKLVLAKAKNKCQYPRCPIKEGGDIKLQIHHIDMINQHNQLSNLKAYCATHHGVIHKKYKLVQKKNSIGQIISSKVVKKEIADKMKKQRKQNPIDFALNFK